MAVTLTLVWRVCLAAVLLSAACAPASSSSGSPRTTMCGKTLDSSAAGAVVTDATAGLEATPVVRAVTARDAVFIKVADGCEHGAKVSWSPITAAKLVDQVDARDQLPVVVVLRPTTRRASFTVTATRNGRQVAGVRIQLG